VPIGPRTTLLGVAWRASLVCVEQAQHRLTEHKATSAAVRVVVRAAPSQQEPLFAARPKPLPPAPPHVRLTPPATLTPVVRLVLDPHPPSP